MTGKGYKRLVFAVGGPVILFSAYVWLALRIAYGEGERAGILQRLSRRGWVCKTYEGELAMTSTPGVTPVIWRFTLGDDKLAPQLNSMLGERVVIDYHEHRGVPTTCFGETGFFVEAIRLQEEARTTR